MTQEGKATPGAMPGNPHQDASPAEEAAKRARRTSPRGRGRPQIPADPREHARRIAAAVMSAWFDSYGGSGVATPMTVVAALALMRPRDPDGPDLGEQILAVPPGEPFARFLRDIWTAFVRMRPDLWPRVHPLVSWLWESPSDTELRAAQAVAQAAVRSGLMHLTADTDRLRQVDLFGVLWQDLHTKRARQRTGQFFTPAPVVDLMAGMVTPQAGSSFHEPCVGTGAMLRGAAGAMREAGDDPATVTWSAVDIDSMAVAACAINVCLWELGPKVLLGVGNGLTDGWIDQAVAERREAIDAAETALALREARQALSLLGAADLAGRPAGTSR